MKTLLTTLFLLIAISITAQKKDIVRILNKGLRKEIQYQLKDRYFDGDTTTVVQPFAISDQNILSLKVRKYNSSLGKYQIVLQEVLLDSIRSIDKDINVLFRTKQDVVTITVFDENSDQPAETNKTHLFFTHIHTLKKNESFGNSIQNAFEGAGFTIEKEYWFD